MGTMKRNSSNPSEHVSACDEGIDTRAEIAERFALSESWI
jgi:hypothetical protein